MEAEPNSHQSEVAPAEKPAAFLETFEEYAGKEQVLRDLHDAFLEGIELFAGRECRDQCEQSGLDQLHLHFPYDRLGMLEPFVLGRLKTGLLQWCAKMGRETLGLDQEFFVQDLLLLRVNYPFGHSQPESEGLARPALRHKLRYGLSNLFASTQAAWRSGAILQQPKQLISHFRNRDDKPVVAYRGHPGHLDSWFGQPIRAWSVWLAIAGLERGNSMCMYPETEGVRMPQDDSLYFGSGFLLPKPTHPDVQDGELLVFSTDMLHCTRLNESNKTRIALSLRLSAQTPLYDEENLWFIEEWHSSEKLIAGDRSVPSRCGSQRVSVSSSEASWEHTPQISIEASFQEGETYKIGSSDQIAEGKKVAVDFENERFIVLRLDGMLSAFRGTCPHGAYRLADGHSDERSLTCPGHGLEFDLRTGESKIPCFSLDRVAVTETDGEVSLG